jgi:response regulator of citrate/malate metabolism
MIGNNTTSESQLPEGKDNHLQGQLKMVFEAFSNPATMLMVAKSTGIERANICRYIATLKKNDKIYLQKKGICKVSRYRAGYYTTKKNLLSQPLMLF